MITAVLHSMDVFKTSSSRLLRLRKPFESIDNERRRRRIEKKPFIYLIVLLKAI